jgi:hypothetical protein
MAGGFLAPLVMFWLYVWGPLRPFDYPRGDVGVGLPGFLAVAVLSAALWWVPKRYYELRGFERSGGFYASLGVRLFRRLVPDGDFANRWRRRREPLFRMIRGRGDVSRFMRRTEESERGHLVLLAFGIASAAFAWHIGWRGWALYLTCGNVVANVYPILLQRYTRSRLLRLLSRP